MLDMVIHFICRGNAFRSIIAEAYMNSLELPGVTVSSSGTCASKHKESNAKNFPKTLALLQKNGIKHYAKNHYADDLNQELVDKSDIVVCLNEIAYKEAKDLIKLPEKTYVWNVTDIGEEGRIANSDAEREALSHDVYAEIIKNIDDLIELNQLRKN